MKHLYFVRHGESELNAANKWAGHTDTLLTANGRSQAKKAGQLAKSQSIKFDLVISSPLARAHETAKIIAKETGYPIEKIVMEPRLMERHYGELEAKSHASIVGAKYFMDETHIEKYGAEKLTDLQTRAEEVLAYLRTLKPDNILVVGHGASGRALWRAVHGHPIHIRDKRYANAEIEQLI